MALEDVFDGWKKRAAPCSVLAPSSSAELRSSCGREERGAVPAATPIFAAKKLLANISAAA
jgi:hypothetical protein